MIVENLNRLSRDELEEKYFRTMIWYFSEKKDPTGFFYTIGSIRDEIKVLNGNLKNASHSSTKLASALNRLTFFGILIGASGVIVSVVALLYKIFGAN